MRTEVCEEQIKTGLRGDAKTQFDAICKAIETYADALAACVRENYPLLDSHELAEAVDDVFLELARKAKNGDFKADGSLKSLLFRMVRFNAADQLRKKYRWQKNKALEQIAAEVCNNESPDELTDDEVATFVAQRLGNAPDIATAWRVVTHENGLQQNRQRQSRLCGCSKSGLGHFLLCSERSPKLWRGITAM